MQRELRQMQDVWYSMIHYNNDNNAYCLAVNAQNVEIRQHKYSINNYILIHKKPIFLFTFRDVHLHL